MTAAVRTASTMPVIDGFTPNEACRLDATELDCTMLPMPKAASATKPANMVPSHGRPMPLLKTYIAPPRIWPVASFSR